MQRPGGFVDAELEGGIVAECEILKASLIHNNTLRLGASRFNVNQFEPVRIAKVPRNGAVVRESKLNEKIKTNISDTYFLPEVFADAIQEEGSEVVEGILSGRRAFCFPNETQNINLKEFGWSKEDVFQEFVVDVKGAGIKLNTSEYMRESDLIGFLRYHRLSGKFSSNLGNQLVFSFNDYKQFGIPEGAQLKQSAQTSLKGTNYFLKNGKVKIAPTACMIVYPEKVHSLANELSYENEMLDCILTQEKRLMPSFVRASYLEYNPGRNSEIVRMVNDDKKKLEELVDVMMDDVVSHFEVIPETARQTRETKGKESEFQWMNVGYTSSIFKDPDKLFGKPCGWFIVKDIVISNSGLYFVDMETVEMLKTESKKEMEENHKLHFTTLFKDFFRFFANYEIAVAEESDASKMEKIESDSRHKLIERISQSKYFEIGKKKNNLELNVSYKTMEPKKYSIDYAYLPKVVR
jgi:hypothetical protein